MSATVLSHPAVSAFGPLHHVRAAAMYLGITEAHVRRLIRSGELKGAWTPNGRLRGIFQRQLDTWLAATTADRQPEPTSKGVDLRMAELMKTMGISR